ncbi:UDP-glucose/GDP-mannose dehydrogenase family protein [Salicibibacter halophilus]|uniref:UDP-glucose 6-dehydrogenase n=1 Tax=Salicibibacter halophilus TaxID=2502791 RepID=A0A514LKN7_9BACI|nr:UDP-glucose/GDP-mannose dehydrogenase family protein [Salicibibacter halophilus]QDI91821.1 UDP-glucose/GDP-mannose dehydrogenase family protein [Salicibibacter halophilus]
MKLTIVGTGYVGLVSGVCFAELGNNVVCVDKDEQKVEQLKQGMSPIYEDGLEPLLQKNIHNESIHFTSDLANSAMDSDIIMIAVGTPQRDDGSADLSFVRAVAEELAEALPADRQTVIVNKSTVPIGSAEEVESIIRKKNANADIAVCSVPEFLREGSAVKDTFNPDRIVIGTDIDWASERLVRLHASLADREQIITTSARSAEMIKYASNAFLATKISFINEIANICDAYGADIDEVARGVGADRRISPHFLSAGLGFGGSCFPKDVQALISLAKDKAYEANMLNSTIAINAKQRLKPVDILQQRFPQGLQNFKIAVLGLAFKPGTDDMRYAPSIDIIHELVKAGADVHAHDPIVLDAAAPLLPRAVTLHNEAEDALSGAEATLLVTEWDMYKQYSIADMSVSMAGKIIIDGRNTLDANAFKAHGFDYYGIGRR